MRRERAVVLPGSLVELPATKQQEQQQNQQQQQEEESHVGNNLRIVSETHARSTILGRVVTTTATKKEQQQEEEAQNTNNNNIIDVFPLVSHEQQNLHLGMTAPTAGSTVLFRVTKVQNIGAAGPIVAIEGKWCLPTFRGIVRLDDIRAATAKEIAAGLVPTHAAASYRLGDLVAADVISLSEARQFQLTTAPAHCGVVKVFSERKSDGKYKHASSTRRDQIIVESESSAGDERLVSRWVPSSAAVVAAAAAKES